MTMCKTRGEKIDLQVGYRKKNREVKHSARANRSKWMSWLGKEMQLQMRVKGEGKVNPLQARCGSEGV